MKRFGLDGDLAYRCRAESMTEEKSHDDSPYIGEERSSSVYVKLLSCL